jgi:hypothetical protein
MNQTTNAVTSTHSVLSGLTMSEALTACPSMVAPTGEPPTNQMKPYMRATTPANPIIFPAR